MAGAWHALANALPTPRGDIPTKRAIARSEISSPRPAAHRRRHTILRSLRGRVRMARVSRSARSAHSAARRGERAREVGRRSAWSSAVSGCSSARASRETTSARFCLRQKSASLRRQGPRKPPPGPQKLPEKHSAPHQRAVTRPARAWARADARRAHVRV